MSRERSGDHIQSNDELPELDNDDHRTLWTGLGLIPNPYVSSVLRSWSKSVAEELYWESLGYWWAVY